MNEPLRQRFLKQMGFTPWVLARPVAGVPVLPEILLEAEAAAPPSIELAPVTPAQVLATLQPEPTPLLSTVPAPATPAEPESPPAVADLVHDIALIAFHAAHCWLLVEQEDPQAPELSREGFQLVNGMLKVVGGVMPGEPRRWLAGAGLGFELPLNVARRSLELFLQGLQRHQPLPVLLLASAPTQALLEQARRYEPVPLADTTLLALSSLGEMLADVEGHKRPSWQAMLRAGVVNKG